MVYWDKDCVPYPGNSMVTTHFVFGTNAMIQRVRVGNIQVNISYAISLHNIKPQNSNHYM